MKRVLSIISCVLLVFVLSFPIFADTDMPYWYPEDTYGFTDFHSENLRRVVDDADILTDEQEANLNTRMEEVVGKYGIGYVLFTDDDNHGLSPEEYSSDFLHFGGYGVGDGYGAVVFYLCFDPSDRCWRTTSINSYESIFTSSVTYDIDETVDADIRAGRYYEAFYKHINFVEALFSKTTDNLAEWYPDEITNTLGIDRDSRVYKSEPALSNKRITDNGGYFSESAKTKAETSLKELSEKYGYDLVVFTDKGYNTLRRGEYADDFYYYNGYGENGAVLYILEDDMTGTVYYGILFEGECYDKYDELAGGLLDVLEKPIDDDDYNKALENYIDSLDFVIGHNRLPMETKSKLMCFAIAVIAGLIAGGIHIARCRRGMRVVAPVDAHEYLVKDSFKLRDKKVYYLYSTVTKTAKPKSSGSSGGSSYSSGSSSGGSYSSGGRSF